MNKIGIVLTLLISLNTQAQKRILETFSLEEHPHIHEINEEYKDEAAVIIQDFRTTNINYRDNAERYQINTVHQIIHLNNQFGVKHYNELHIYLSKNEELLKVDIRAISPTGKVTVLNNDNIKDFKTDGKTTEKRIAIEGLEVGGELEFLYSIKTPIMAYERMYFEPRYPIQHLKFELIEKNTGHSAASYNGLPPVKSVNGNLICEDFNVEPTARETRSNYRSKLKYIDYRIEVYDKYYELVTWKSISVDILEQFQTLSQRINTFLKDLELDQLNQEEQIFKIEDYIKENIAIEYESDESYEDIAQIQKRKIANHDGIVKLYLKCFQKLKIPVDLVLSTSRYSGTIDENYPHKMDLDYPLLYFPTLDKYIDPDNMALRLGIPTAKYGKSRAFKIKTKPSKGLMFFDLDTFDFVTLPLLDARYNTSQRTYNVNLSEENTLVNVEFTGKSRGYIASDLRYEFEQQVGKEIDVTEWESHIEDAKIDSLSFENLEVTPQTKPTTPFVVHLNYKSESLVENMGEEILVHLGDLLGDRTKAYGDSTRAHAVVLEYPKLFERKINIQIPEGYTCSNLEDLKKHIYFTHNKTDMIYFNSSYTIENNTLKIKVQEGYKTILINKTNYNDYKTVINAAADFSELVLVFEKE